MSRAYPTFPGSAQQRQVRRTASGTRRSLRRLRVHFRRHLANGAGKLLGRLRAGDRIFAREHKGRHAGDALVGGLLRLRRDQLHVFIGRKTLAHVLGVETAIGRGLHQHIHIGEIAAVAKI